MTSKNFIYGYNLYDLDKNLLQGRDRNYHKTECTEVIGAILSAAIVQDADVCATVLATLVCAEKPGPEGVTQLGKQRDLDDGGKYITAEAAARMRAMHEQNLDRVNGVIFCATDTEELRQISAARGMLIVYSHRILHNFDKVTKEFEEELLASASPIDAASPLHRYEASLKEKIDVQEILVSSIALEQELLSFWRYGDTCYVTGVERFAEEQAAGAGMSEEQEAHLHKSLQACKTSVRSVIQVVRMLRNEEGLHQRLLMQEESQRALQAELDAQKARIATMEAEAAAAIALAAAAARAAAVPPNPAEGAAAAPARVRARSEDGESTEGGSHSSPKRSRTAAAATSPNTSEDSNSYGDAGDTAMDDADAVAEEEDPAAAPPAAAGAEQDFDPEFFPLAAHEVRAARGIQRAPEGRSGASAAGTVASSGSSSSLGSRRSVLSIEQLLGVAVAPNPEPHSAPQPHAQGAVQCGSSSRTADPPQQAAPTLTPAPLPLPAAAAGAGAGVGAGNADRADDDLISALTADPSTRGNRRNHAGLAMIGGHGSGSGSVVSRLGAARDALQAGGDRSVPAQNAVQAPGPLAAPNAGYESDGAGADTGTAVDDGVDEMETEPVVAVVAQGGSAAVTAPLPMAPPAVLPRTSRHAPLAADTAGVGPVQMPAGQQEAQPAAAAVTAGTLLEAQGGDQNQVPAAAGPPAAVNFTVFYNAQMGAIHHDDIVERRTADVGVGTEGDGWMDLAGVTRALPVLPAPDLGHVWVYVAQSVDVPRILAIEAECLELPTFEDRLDHLRLQQDVYVVGAGSPPLTAMPAVYSLSQRLVRVLLTAVTEDGAI